MTLPAIAFGYFHLTGFPYILLLAAAALTDVYDGQLARKFGVETGLLRQWDSAVDTIFFVGVMVGMYFAYPEVVQKYLCGILAIPALEVVRYVFDYIKFGKGAAYHALSAKIFGVSALIACIAIMGFGLFYPFLICAIFLGIYSEIEGLLFSILLANWTYNVRHIGIVLKTRGQK